MQLIPVIDLKGGVVVRGVRGERNDYRPLVSSLSKSADPNDVARALVDNFQPASIYVADLDAITRGQLQDAAWEAIASKGTNLLVDAGVRNTQQADKYMGRLRRQIGLGSRLVIGLETFETLSELPALVGSFVFSLDLKEGQPITRDPQWQAATPQQIAGLVAASNIPTLIILDLADVGSGRGPSTLPLIRAVHAQYPNLEIIAGGGVRNREDLLSLQQAGASAALVASALHDRKITAADVPY
jgi:phosphoribosylformimino-5-aminoimidazole carboxamide ribotide isomerase